MTTIYPIDYDRRMREYNIMVAELEEKRRKFYEENPDFPFKTLFMNVTAPPMKLIINEIN